MSGDSELVGEDNRCKPNQLSKVSERKLRANRENAKKSTGPRTTRGQAQSRRNAVKHGLFVRHITDFEALDEDPREYEELLNGLWSQYQPLGRAEELEVERIALCYWRLKRAWRYENVTNLAALGVLAKRSQQVLIYEWSRFLELGGELIFEELLPSE